MEKERHRGTSRLQFSKEEQMQAVRAGQPESSHSLLLHQGCLLYTSDAADE